MQYGGEELHVLYYNYGLWLRILGYGSPIAFCSDGVLCHLTRIVLYSTYSAIPAHDEREIITIGYPGYEVSRSLHLLPQEEIEDAACCEAEPWMHRYCIVFDGKDAGA